MKHKLVKSAVGTGMTKIVVLLTNEIYSYMLVYVDDMWETGGKRYTGARH